MRGSGCRKGNVVSATLESETGRTANAYTGDNAKHSTPYTIRDQWDLLGIKKKTDV